MCREKLRNNDNDNAEVSREDAGRGERWKDIIDRVASRTLGGTHTPGTVTGCTQAVYS